MSVRVSSWVWDHSPVEHRGDLLVLLVLADHAHDDGTSSYPSVGRIAKKARLSHRGTQLALRRLEDLGAIERTGESAQHRPATYRVIMAGPGVQCVRPEVTSWGEVTSAQGRSDVRPGVQGTSPEPSEPLEPSEPPKPPKGGRARDRIRWEIATDSWLERWLPRLLNEQERHKAIEQAVAAGAGDAASIESFLQVYWPELAATRRPAAAGGGR